MNNLFHKIILTYYNNKIDKIDPECLKIGIFEYAGIGDFFISSITIKAIIEKYKDRKIVLIVSESVYEIAKFYFSSYKNVDIIMINYSKFIVNSIYRLNLIRKYFFEKFYLTHPTVTNVMNDILDKFIIKECITYEGELEYYPRNKVKHNNVNYIKNLIKSKKNIILHQQKYTEQIVNVSIKLEQYKFLGEKLDKKNFINSKELNVNDKYIVLIPETSTSSKDFTIEQVQEIINKINCTKIVILGIKKSNSFLNGKNVINLINKTSLIESMAIIKYSSMVIGNDTGLLHFAYLIGKKTFVAIGGWQYGRYYPSLTYFSVHVINHYMECYNCNFNCYDKKSVPFPCIQKINIDKLIEEVNYYIEQSNER